MSNVQYPSYIKDKNGKNCLRLTDPKKPTYYRDGGRWSVNAKINANGELVSVCGHMRKLSGIVYEECTYDEWVESNKGYVPTHLLPKDGTRNDYNCLIEIQDL